MSDINSGFDSPRSPRPGDALLTPAQQFRLTDRASIQRTNEHGARIFFDNGSLQFSQPGNNQEYAYLRKGNDKNALVTLKMNPDGKVEKIIAVAPLDTIAAIIETAEDMPLRDELRELLHLPEVTPEIRARVSQALAEQETRKARIAALESSKSKERPIMQERDDAVRVLQHEAGITRADRPSRYLSTFRAGPCVIVTFYDAQTKTGALTHLDGSTTYDS